MAEENKSATLENSVTIEDIGPCKKKVSVEVPADAIKNALDEQYGSLRKEAVVPGFRKGRAPRRLLEKRFGKEVADQVKLKLLADASDSALKDNQLDVLRDPDIDFEQIELPAEGPLKFEFEVEVRPEFELPKLEGIPVQRRSLQVTDEQIDREIEQLRKWAGLWTPRQDGKVEPEDQVIADVVIKCEDAEEEKLDNIEIHVRPNGFVGAIPVEKLDELLTGAKLGESRQTTVEVPKTYFREEYRGKRVDITVDIKDIKWLKPAEINEDFLKRFDVENEHELREKMRDMLQGRLEQQVRAEMTDQIYRYMLDSTDFELPLDVVADQARTILVRQQISLMQRGISREQLEEQMDQLKAGSEEQAKEQLKTFFIMDKVAKELGIEVTEEEVNGHIARLAIQQGQRPERLREQMLRDGSLSQFRLQVREEKCIAKLLESAQITEVEPEKKASKKKKTAKKSRATTSQKTKKTSAGKSETGNQEKKKRKSKTNKETD